MFVTNYCRERCAKRKEGKEKNEKHGRRGGEVSGDGWGASAKARDQQAEKVDGGRGGSGGRWEGRLRGNAGDEHGGRVALPWFGLTYLLTNCFYDLA